MPYLLDANVFIQAKNLHYGLDFCPAFWDWLVARNGAGDVFSIERVGDEIEAGGDDLAAWAAARGPDFFLKPDAVNTFLSMADYYLVGHALAHGHVVVTHEKASTSTKKVKIPEPCIGLGIKCMMPFEMLRRERARFVLGRAGQP